MRLTHAYILAWQTTLFKGVHYREFSSLVATEHLKTRCEQPVSEETHGKRVKGETLFSERPTLVYNHDVISGPGGHCAIARSGASTSAVVHLNLEYKYCESACKKDCLLSVSRYYYSYAVNSKQLDV